MRNRVAIISALLVFLTVAAAPAHALIYVQRARNGTCSPPSCIEPWSPGANITIAVDNLDFVIWVFSTTGNEDIGRITITGAGTNPIYLVIGNTTATTNGSLTQGQAGGVNWGGLTTGRSNISVNGRITGNLTGGVLTSTINYLQIDGEMQRFISNGLSTSDAFGAGAPFDVVAGSVTTSGGLDARVGRIGRLRVLGNMLGDVFTSQTAAGTGYVTNILVDGNIGSTTRNSTITVRGLSPASWAIDSISCANLYATIGNGAVSPASPAIPVRATAISNNFAAGVYSLSSFDTFQIARDLAGTLNHSQTMASGKTVIVGRSLTSTGTINFPADGIAGQVALNRNNGAGAEQGFWNGAVNINSVALVGPPYYTTPANDIGGGAAGLAAYNLHKSSCVPVGDSIEPEVTPVGCGSTPSCNVNAPNSAGARTWATLRMYGPVVFDLTGGGTPLTVKRRTYPFAASWVDVTSDFRFDIFTTQDGGGGAPDAGKRVIRVRRVGTDCEHKWFPVGYEYKIEPVAGKLKCEGVAGGNTVDVFPFAYHFTLPVHCEPCSAPECDITADGLVGGGDLAAWFASPIDMNGDGPVNGGDAIRIIEGMPR